MAEIDTDQWQEVLSGLEKRILEHWTRFEELGIGGDHAAGKNATSALQSLLTAHSELLDEFDRILNEEKHDTVRLDELFEEVTTWIVIVGLHIEKWELVEKAVFQLRVQLTTDAMKKFLKRARKAIPKMEAKLAKLKDRLEEAKKELKEAKWQRRINVALSIIGTFTGPLGALATGLGSLATDAALGPEKFDDVGTVVNGTTIVAEAVENLDKINKKLLGALASIYSYKSDTDEIEQAKRIVADVKQKVETLRKAYKLLRRIVRGASSGLRTIRVLALRAKKNYEEAAEKIIWVDQAIEQLKQELPEKPTAYRQGTRHQWGAEAVPGRAERYSTFAARSKGARGARRMPLSPAFPSATRLAVARPARSIHS